MKSAVLDVKTSPEGDQFIEIPEEMLKEAGWEVGDDIVWSDNKDGSFTLTKSKHDLVLVETVSMFKMQYLVKVPKGKAAWALDTVVCNEAQELIQQHIDENIFSHRIINAAQAEEMYRMDNEFFTGDFDLDKHITEIDLQGNIVK